MACRVTGLAAAAEVAAILKFAPVCSPMEGADPSGSAAAAWSAAATVSLVAWPTSGKALSRSTSAWPAWVSCLWTAWQRATQVRQRARASEAKVKGGLGITKARSVSNQLAA